MRFARSMTFGFLTVMLLVSGARADNGAPRNFGTTNCRQQFSCSATDSTQLSAMANTCATQGLGLSTDGGIFDSVSPDGNNCLTAPLPVSTSGKNAGSSPRAADAQCCVTANGDTCGMFCQLLVH